MKLLTRLRELRDEHYPAELNEIEFDEHADNYDDESDNEHLDTIGVGATTVDDIIRLNLEHGYLQDQTSHAHFVY